MTCAAKGNRINAHPLESWCHIETALFLSVDPTITNDFLSKLIKKTEPLAELGEILQTNTCKHVKIAPIIKAVGDFEGFNRLENMLHLMTMHLNQLISGHQKLTSNTFAARIPAKPQMWQSDASYGSHMDPITLKMSDLIGIYY
jgi:hypothetical protein